MRTILSRLDEAGIFFKVFVRWLLISVVIGTAGGILGSAFYKSIALVTSVRESNPWLILLLPAGGLLIVWIYRITHTQGLSTNDIIDSILNGKKVDILLLPVIFVCTVITHLLGGSAGREGAALQIGGSLGFNTGKLLKMEDKEARIAVLSGMSAVFSALFGTPVTATVFALEVCSVGIIHYSGLVPCGIAALTAYWITTLLNIEPTHFVISAMHIQPVMIFKICILAILCAVLSVVFCEFMHLSSATAAKLIKNDYLRAATGGFALMLLTFLVGNYDYTGGGTGIIAREIYEGQAKPAAFLLKMIFTAITLSAGFKGGEIVPTFFIGATFGCIIGPLLGVPAQFAAAVCLIGTFCGAVNCPLASVILSVELFGSESIIYFSVVCFISYMLSGYSGLYSSQKIIYSKLKADYLDAKTE
jgi:H+/Cl- antiporter ClcA